MEAEFLFPRDRFGVAARLAVLCLALAFAGCTAVENPVNSPASLSTGSAVNTSSALIELAGVPPATVTVGNSYYYAPTVSQGGGSISFSIQGQPAWTSFDPQTGALTGTPTAADVGVSGGITITATSSVNTASVGPFSIEVDPAGNTSSAPIVLAGVPPATVTVGNPYYYAPTVSQGSGTISFSIQGQPPWTSFDSETGALTGTPTADDVGVSGGITITAANSVNAASVGPFSIEVDPAASTGPTTGSATLNWSPPTENADGSPLRNLAGYYIHYGTSHASLTQTIDLADAAATGYVVTDLTPGTYYFAVGAYNSLGLEGVWSNVTSKTL